MHIDTLALLAWCSWCQWLVRRSWTWSPKFAWSFQDTRGYLSQAFFPSPEN